MNILNKLTIKHLKMNKKRTIVTIIGVILSTSLMVGIGLIVSSIRDMAIKDITYYDGSQHVILDNVVNTSSGVIENNIKIKNYDKMGIVGSKMYEDYKSIMYSITDDYFKKFELEEGTYAINNKEIVVSDYIANQYNVKLNDNIKLDDNVSFKVVGIYNSESVTFLNDLNMYTTDYETEYSKYYITFNKPKMALDAVEELNKTLNLKYEDINTNDSLLAFYGASKYDNVDSAMTGMIIIILGLISIGCIVVIYNSFAISVMERKKQFGLFSSIGATKKQLIKTVYYEAFIIALIGIPLGIIASYLGIGIVFAITNKLLDLGSIYSLGLVTYPLFVIVPIIFMIFVILISAYLPSRRASKISPIEAIRLNDDIKIKSKKVRTPKFIRKIFGVEGEIALKNMKRNKKKYRITIISLFTSVVLFVSFSSFIDYIIGGTDMYVDIPNYDLIISGEGLDEETKSELFKNREIEDYIIFTYYTVSSPISIREHYNASIKDKLNPKDYERVTIVVLDDNNYNKYLKSINEVEEKPIIYNHYKKISYANSTRKVELVKKFDSLTEIEICESNFNKEYEVEMGECYNKISDFHITDVEFSLLSDFNSFSSPVLFVNKKIFDSFNIRTDKTESVMIEYNDDGTITIKEEHYENILIKAEDNEAIETYISKYVDLKSSNSYAVNIAKEYKLLKNLKIVVKLFVYGFISLVTLIGVTSVVNTINTSIALRRKEFAVLRSIGLTSKGFNKILYFESFFVGLRALMYSLPVSVVIIFLIHNSMSELVAYNSLMLPFKNMLFAIIGVFVIILFTMMYASRKVKKENILETIREENI